MVSFAPDTMTELALIMLLQCLGNQVLSMKPNELHTFVTTLTSLFCFYFKLR